MKKTYIAPLTEVVKVNAGQIICSSPVDSITGIDGVTKGEGKLVGGASDSKDWDDYDEDLW